MANSSQNHIIRCQAQAVRLTSPSGHEHIAVQMGKPISRALPITAPGDRPLEARNHLGAGFLLGTDQFDNIAENGPINLWDVWHGSGVQGPNQHSDCPSPPCFVLGALENRLDLITQSKRVERLYDHILGTLRDQRLNLMGLRARRHEDCRGRLKAGKGAQFPQ